jgi:tetratricopeptide (TPR) repeat protein
MRTALERRWGRLEAVGSREWLAPVPAVGAALAAVVGASIFFGGGSSDGRLVWIGGAAIVVATAAFVVSTVGAMQPPVPTPLALAAVAFFVGLVVWQGLSVLWSAEPDRSWNYVNRAVAYLALFVLGVAAGRLRAAPRVAAATLAAMLFLAIGCALATKIFPGLSTVNDRVARLSAPIGYWNALALLVDMALPLALWIAAPRSRPHWLRAVGVLLLYAAGVALLLTFSRGGLAVGLLALALWFAIGRPRLESAGALALALAPMLAVVGWAFTREGLTKDAEPHSVQVHDGRWFALALVVGGLAALGIAYAASVLEERWPATDVLRRRLGEVAAVAGAIAVLAGIAALVAAGITPSKVFHKFNEPVAAQAAQGPGRLGLVSSSSRWNWWKESWDAWREHPALGTGAGSFDITHRRLRVDDTFATEPHNLPLQFLTEAGIIGFVLFVGIVFAGAAALAESLRRLDGEARLAAAALSVGLFAYVVHGVVDFDWDFVAVTAPALAVLGVLLAAGRPTLPRLPVRRTLLSAAVGAIAAAALYSLVSPWLASQKVDDAYAAIERGAAAAAVSDAKTAHSLNPAAVDPLLVWAAAEHARGDDGEAGRLYTKAISIQPDNWRPWYYRARFLQNVDGPKAALYDAKQAAKRDPRGGAGAYAAGLQQQLGATSR